jgi:hypothetical protein
MLKSRLIQEAEVRNFTQKCFELVWVKREFPVGFVRLLGGGSRCFRPFVVGGFYPKVL